MKKLKMTISLVLSCVLFSSLFVFNAYAEDVIKGDINGDGEVKVADARIVLSMAAHITEPDVQKADMNSDGIVSLEDARAVLAISVDLVELPEKTGENLISDDPENEFIKLISETYKIDSKALVAIYAVPDLGNNFVLEFGKKSAFSSEYSRSTKDLKKVYQIDLERNINIATSTGIGCVGCSMGESILIFNLVKTVMMPEFPDYFTDI